MKFNNGKFKILVLSDVHTPNKVPKYTRLFCERVIAEESPDLIVLLGDNTAGRFPGVTPAKTKKAVNGVLSLVGDTPFALVFGNHDHEGLPKLETDEAKRLLLSYYREKPNCLATEGEKRLDGVGNYSIPLTDSEGKEIFSLFFMDSGTYLEGGYSSVRESQNNWFEKECKTPSIVFQHIIPEEIYSCCDVSSTPKKGYIRGQCEYRDKYYKFKSDLLLSGNMLEGPCPGKLNFNQASSWRKTGKVLAGVFGHDHINDFDVMWEGIRLINTPSPSFYTYGNNRGVRTITIYEDKPTDFETRVIHYGDIMTEKPLNPLVNRYGIAAYRERYLPYILGGMGAMAGISILLSKVKKK